MYEEDPPSYWGECFKVPSGRVGSVESKYSTGAGSLSPGDGGTAEPEEETQEKKISSGGR